MNGNYNIKQIINFFKEEIDDRLEAFCNYCVVEGGHAKFRFINWNGRSVEDKARDKCLELDNDGVVHDLIFYLVGYWKEEREGSNEKLLEYGLHEDLALAAQAAWYGGKRDPKQARKCFGWLADIHQAFRQEWTFDKSQTIFSKPPPAEWKKNGYKSVEQLVAHLAYCRQLYVEAQNHLEKGACIQAQQTLLKLDEFHPDYADVRVCLKTAEARLVAYKEQLATAHQLYENRAWSAAREAFLALPEQVRDGEDIPGWVYREADVARMQQLVDVAQVGFLYDPRLPWGEDYPYRLFDALATAVTPQTPGEQIKETLKALESISDTQRTSLEQIVESEDRLFMDMFLVPIPPSLVSKLEKILLEQGQLPSLDDFIKQHPQDGAILAYLWEAPEKASAAWWDAQQQQPLETWLAHYQGLFYLAQTYVQGSADLGVYVDNWQHVISQWAVALSDSAYWLKWGQARYTCYGVKRVVYTSLTNLQLKMRKYLEGLLEVDYEQAQKQRDEERVEQITHLMDALVIEFAAVQLLQALGGVPLDSGHYVWFGPLWMRQFGWEKSLAQYVATARLDASLFDPMVPESDPKIQLQRVRWYFSYLGRTAIQLEKHTLAQNQALSGSLAKTQAKKSSFSSETILAILAQDTVETPNCDFKNCVVHGNEKEPPVNIICPNWGEFNTYAPAYTGLAKADRVKQLCEDTLLLVIEVHWQMGLAQISGEGIHNSYILRRSWQKVVNLAGFSQDRDKIWERLKTVVLSQTEELHGSLTRLNTLVTLLKITLSILQEDNFILKNRLVQLLVSRGLIRLETGDFLGTIADLRQALTESPKAHDIRVQLIDVLNKLAFDICQVDRFLALDYLRQSTQLIAEAEEKYPGYDYSAQQAWIIESQQNLLKARSPKSEPEGVGSEPQDVPPAQQILTPEDGLSEVAQRYGQGVGELRQRQFDKALNTFGQLLEDCPDDPDVLIKAEEALLAYVWQLIDEKGHVKTGLAKLEEWQAKLPQQADKLAKQALFLEKWLLLRPCLKPRFDSMYTIHHYQEVQLPFGGENVTGTIVRLLVREDDLLITANLPFVHAKDTETVWHHLLQASSEMMLFKPCLHSNNQLVLQGHFPFSLLESAWLFITLWEIVDFADLSYNHLINLEQLRGWLEEARVTHKQPIEVDHFLQKTSRAIRRLCEDKEWEWQEPLQNKEFVIEVPFGSERQAKVVEVLSDKDGVEVSLCLGELRQSNREVYARLLTLNRILGWGKLTIDGTGKVFYSIVLPYLRDDKLAGQVFARLEDGYKHLSGELEHLLDRRGVPDGTRA